MPTTTNQNCLYICKKPALAINNQQFNGNTNNSSKTRAMRYSEIVRTGGQRFVYTTIINNFSVNIISSIEPPRKRV